MNAIAVETGLSPLERRLLDEYQRDLPLVERPFAAMAAALGCSEREVIDTLAGLEVSAYDEVNHNYAREHAYNLWLVVVAPDAARLRVVLDDIAARTGLPVLELPLERAYHIDLGFRLWR